MINGMKSFFQCATPVYLFEKKWDVCGNEKQRNSFKVRKGCSGRVAAFVQVVRVVPPMKGYTGDWVGPRDYSFTRAWLRPLFFNLPGLETPPNFDIVTFDVPRYRHCCQEATANAGLSAAVKHRKAWRRLWYPIFTKKYAQYNLSFRLEN